MTLDSQEKAIIEQMRTLKASQNAKGLKMVNFLLGHIMFTSLTIAETNQWIMMI
ncbi:MAG: hypothetical protein ACKPER_07255 [Dolichospermum sp.]